MTAGLNQAGRALHESKHGAPGVDPISCFEPDACGLVRKILAVQAEAAMNGWNLHVEQTKDTHAQLVGTLALIADGRGPAKEMAQAVLDRVGESE